MTQYYVAPTGANTNPGTSSQPFATISYAARRCVPGDVVHVAAGTYIGSVETYTSGTSAAHITYVSDTNWGAVIVGTANDAWYNEGSYVDIIGFDITTNNANSLHGINNYGSFVGIRRNRVHDLLLTSCPASGGTGIFQGGYCTGREQSSVDVTENIISNIGPHSTCSTVHGIYHTCTGGIIANNIVSGISGYGIHLWHAATNTTISHNLVFACGTGGILIGNDGASAWANSNNSGIVSNNIVYNNSSFGVREYGNTGMQNQYICNCLSGQSKNVLLQHGLVDQNSLFANPQFVNYQPDGTGDYHLNATSPCIGTGTSVGTVPTDYDGNARPAPGTALYDIGPYTYLSPTPAP